MASFAETAEEFIQHYLRAQSRFLNANSTADRLKPQQILGVSVEGGKTVLTTSGFGPHQRRRYRVSKLESGWNIIGIELECSICSGSGKLSEERPCDLCTGIGWTTG